MKEDEHHGYRQPVDSPPGEARLVGQPASADHLADLINSWWLFEGLAWIISAAAMAVLVATLFLTDGRPLPHWPMQITLNSFISILGTIIKAAMVVPIAEGISQLKWLWFKKAGVLRDIQTFDEASRGLFGSLKLLLSTKGVYVGFPSHVDGPMLTELQTSRKARSLSYRIQHGGGSLHPTDRHIPHSHNRFRGQFHCPCCARVQGLFLRLHNGL